MVTTTSGTNTEHRQGRLTAPPLVGRTAHSDTRHSRVRTNRTVSASAAHYALSLGLACPAKAPWGAAVLNQKSAGKQQPQGDVYDHDGLSNRLIRSEGAGQW